jgi:hypothetical protein
VSERIRGETGDRMVEAALLKLIPGEPGWGWAGQATDLGVTTYRSDWRRRMRSALEAAFDELLKAPATPPSAAESETQ